MLIDSQVRIFLAFEPVDMRLSFDGLAARVAHMLKADPYSGAGFVFRSKSGQRLKILYWDGVGFWLWYRRLEAGRFIWPALRDDGSIELTAAQLAVLTQGLDWRRVGYPKLYQPTLA